MIRQTLDLTGVWRCQPDHFEEGEDDGYQSADHDVRRWLEAWIPSTMETVIANKGHYEGVMWYRRMFAVPESWQGARVVARFEGVNDCCRVWVNGELVGENEDGCLRIEFPVCHALDYGADNVIVVRVDNRRRPAEVPGLQRGWKASGGILREVSLVVSDRARVDNAKIVAEPTEEGGRFSVRAEIVNGRADAFSGEVAVDIVGPDGAMVATAGGVPVELGASALGTAELQVDVPDAKAWSPAAPTLYTARVKLLSGDEVVDVWETRFGFRRVEVRDSRLLLNGEPIFLMGFNRHEDSPRTGFASDLKQARRDYEEMKAAGVNFVRLCHYPHHPGELDILDELGILALGEIPLAFWPGLRDGEEHFIAKTAAARRQLAKMIRRDWNHPSVIFWSVSNETREQHPEVSAVNQQLVLLAQKLDPTRLAGHVSNKFGKHPYYDCDDVIFVNSYPWMTREKGMRDFSGNTEYWQSALAKLHERYPDKPILITEFGHWGYKGVFGNGLGEDLQARSIEAGLRGMTAPYVCGAAIWCWASHMPGGGLSYAVSTRDRRKLAGFYAARRLFLERQGAAPPDDVCRERREDGWRVRMVRPELEDIPVVEFPEGFGIRLMQAGEGALWTDIWRDAETYGKVDDTWFVSAFADSLLATEWRCFFVVDSRGVAVGTVAAWYDRDYEGQDWGRIHFLGIRPAYQGKGLGRAALCHALRRLAELHERAHLYTYTARLDAIKLYLDVGFALDLEQPHAREAWREVCGSLSHPALDALGL
ncbi:MAG: glycoside hydrolase family 2 protein [Planctomycetota bacterium]|jgi:beta-glucuronidase